MKNINLLASAGAVLFSVSAAAQTPQPYLQPEDTWISLSGTVESVQQNAFMLNYGSGTVTVEMDDVDRDAESYQLGSGDRVVVSGLINGDFFEMTSIDASSVYVEGASAFFHASTQDGDNSTFYDPIVSVTDPIVDGEVTLQGTVTSVNPVEDEFVLNTDTRTLTVEVDNVAQNPLDDEGYIQLDPGDTVSVSGRMSEGFFEDRVFVADYVISVNQ